MKARYECPLCGALLLTDQVDVGGYRVLYCPVCASRYRPPEPRVVVDDE